MGRWLVQEYVTKLDTGGYMMQKIFLDNIPIFFPDKEQLKTIETVCEEVLNQKGNDIYADTSQLENEIDKLVYQLYNLTPEEIKIIEDCVK